MAAPRSYPNFLAGPYLNRVAEWRKDEARLQAAIDSGNLTLVPVWRTRNLVVQTETRISARFFASFDELGRVERSELIFLGEFHESPCFAVELDPETEPLIEAPAAFRDLRTIAGDVPADEAGVLAYARAMITWRERHRYCGRCGARTVPIQGGHVLRCSNAACANPQFPRIDPAIIVLIHDGERALLGRQSAWPPGRFSTIAGFVEPGESLEDAVAREAREETGVLIDSVEYHSSQPWPFPSSLMLGFIAHAATTQIRLADAELEEARWITREQLARGEISFPAEHSISFRLIEEWYDADAVRPLREEPHAKRWGRAAKG